ncbi:hypothetical protein NDU88_002878 [Pleurodeles waltl]|uniref:Uncharacterized protein n=1 Tax=Pleurodeles waltl TaxID=8319 RepID=A0AAV7WMH5_PLEWA|nr:hypothetical protein NDU88_002878 [Pleurodeles waltl]
MTARVLFLFSLSGPRGKRVEKEEYSTATFVSQRLSLKMQEMDCQPAGPDPKANQEQEMVREVVAQVCSVRIQKSQLRGQKTVVQATKCARHGGKT